MTNSIKGIKRHVRLGSYLVAAFALSHTGQAQAQVNNSALTVTGTIVTTSCYVKIALGSGATANASGTGSSTGSVALATDLQNNLTTTTAGAGTALTAVTKFSVGLTSASAGNLQCTGPNYWNTAFLSSTPITSLSGKALLPTTGSVATGLAMELYSYSADGLTQVRAINSYAATTYSGANNTSVQTNLAAVSTANTQTFGVALIKTAASGTALTSGTITGVVTVSYALF